MHSALNKSRHSESTLRLVWIMNVGHLDKYTQPVEIFNDKPRRAKSILSDQSYSLPAVVEYGASSRCNHWKYAHLVRQTMSKPFSNDPINSLRIRSWAVWLPETCNQLAIDCRFPSAVAMNEYQRVLETFIWMPKIYPSAFFAKGIETHLTH